MAILRIKNGNNELVEVPTHAIEMPILDLSEFYNSENVEGALREIGEKIHQGVATPAEIEALIKQLDIIQTNIKTTVKEEVKNLDIGSLVDLDTATLNEIIQAYKDGTLGSGGSGGISEAKFYELLNSKINVTVVNEMTKKYLNGELSGGGSGAVSPTIESEFAKETIIEEGSRVDIDIYFQTPNLGEGVAYITVNGIEIDYYPTVNQGDNIIKIESKYITKTANTISIYVKDRVGMSSNKLTFKVISGGVSLTTTFDYTVDYVVGQNILFPFYTTTELSGTITLEVVIDGIPLDPIECANGYNSFYLNKYITGVGVHAVKMQAFIGDYHSKVLNFNVVISSSTQLILSTDLLEGSKFEYGNSIQMSYRISKLGTEVFTVEFYIDEILVRTSNVQTGNYYWTISGTQMNIGIHKLDIIAYGAGGDRASVSVNIEIIAGEFTPIVPVDQGMVIFLDSDGYSNEQQNKEIWVDKTGNGHNGELINFNFTTNGWNPSVAEVDDNGNEVTVKYNGLVCNNDAYVRIPYKPFLENVINGYTMEIVFTPEHSGNENARVLEYVDHDSPYTGIFIDILEANIKSESETSMGSVDLDYESGEIQMDFVIDRENKMCLMYINGIVSRYWMLSDSGNKRENFAIDTDYIYINFSGLSEKYCGGTNIVRKFIGYERALTHDEIIQNLIANQPDLPSMQAMYKWNYETQIPKLYVYGDISNCSTTNPSYVRLKYESPDSSKYGESFDMESSNSPFYLQGTSSLGYTRKNYRFVLIDSNGKEYYHEMYPGNALPESTYTCKCDYVDSSMCSNVCLAKIANDCIYPAGFTPAQKADPKRRVSIYGHAIELINVVDNEQYSLGAYMINIDRYATKNLGYNQKEFPNIICYEGEANSDVGASAFYSYNNPAGSGNQFPNEIAYLNEGWRVVYPTINEDAYDFAPIKRLVNFVDESSEDDFKDSFEQYFNKEAILRYYLFVMCFGAIDDLSKNLHFCSYDGQIFYVLPYDLDSCLGGTNTGYLRVPPSCEVGVLYDTDGTTVLEENHFNSWNSRLWARVRSTFRVDLENMWTTLRSNGTFNINNLLKYFDEITDVISPKMYNDSQQIKYINDGAVGSVALHGNRKLQIRKWLRERMAYLDSKFGYYANGGVGENYCNFRMNYQGQVSLDISTYYTVYAKVRWATNNEQTIRIARGQKKTFSYYSDVGTDREVMIFLPEALKTIENISNIYPNSIDVSKATKLTEIEAHNTNLYSVDLSKNKYLRKVDFNGCERLGTETATMTLNYCKYLNKVDLRGTQITAVTFNNKGGSLREIYYPTSIQSINLVNQSLLTDMILPYGDGSRAPIDLATINIENCPNISKLIDISSDPTSLNGMKYCRSLTLNNSIKLNRFNFYGFTRLANVNLENMDSLEEVDFLNMTEVGQTSNLRYIGVSACPNMTTITMNVDSPNYEITWANDSILDLQTAGGVKNIYSNCIIKGLNTILLPITIENMYFTNEYGSGYSDIINIWSPSSATVSKTGVYPVAYHLNENDEADDYIGIDFKDLHLYNIDLGALVKIPNAINFSLYPTNTNPNFNKNRDGNTLPYLQPVGTLDLSNYTESLARFFNGVNLNKLQLIVNKTLPQTDLSYCFYNSTFDNGDRIAPILENLISVSNMDYCFYKTSISDISILNRVNFANGTSMKYCFAYCPNIIELTDITMSSKIGDSSYMFSGSGLTTVKNVTTSSRNITGFFSYCKNLVIVENFVADGTDSYESLFQGCAMSLPPLTSIPDNIVNIKNMYRGCPNLTSINNFVFHENLVEVEGFILDCKKLVNANNITIAGPFYNDVFRGVTSIKYVNNLLITYVGRSMTFAHMFDGCAALEQMSFHDDSYVKEVISMNYMFKGTSMKTVDFSNVNFEKVTSWKYMFADSYMTEFSCTIPETIINIQGFLSGCTKLKTLRNFINAHTINAVDWLLNTNVENIIDCQFNTLYTKFTDYTSLKKVQNLTYTGSVFNDYFSGCTNLQTASINISSSTTKLDNAFKDCPNLLWVDFLESDLSAVTTIDGIFNNDINLSAIYDLKITNPNTYASNQTLIGCPLSITDGLYINSNSALDMFRIGENSAISEFTDFEFGSDATDLSMLFANYPKLIKDIYIPSHVLNVSQMFYNCLLLENVQSNWTNSYDMNNDTDPSNDVITTDCYAGCTNIKYIDGDLYMNEYGELNAIYNIPVEWGGIENFLENQNVFEVNTAYMTDNTITLAGNNGIYITDWGDGTIDKLITHTYTKTGKYRIITDNSDTFGTGFIVDSELSKAIVNVLHLDIAITNGSHLFDGWVNLLTIRAMSNTFNSYDYMFNNCSNLLDPDFNNVTWGQSVTSVTCMCNNCNKFTKSPISIIPDSCTNMDYLFDNTNISDLNKFTIGSGIISYENWIPPQLINFNDCIIKSNHNYFEGNTTIQYTKNLNRPNTTSWLNYFNGCTSLKEDIYFPLNTTDVTNCYYNCSSLTRIHNNWNNTYTNGITSTDCYAKCSNISYIDDVYILKFEGDLGLDYIPIKWGGYEFLKSTTGIYVIDTNKVGSLTLNFSDVDKLGTINWGDGTITTDTRVHTYSSHGIYTIKSKVPHNRWGTPHYCSSDVANGLIEVIQVSDEYLTDTSAYRRIAGGFANCINLKKVNISYGGSGKADIGMIDGLFKNCSSLEEIIGLETINITGAVLGQLFYNNSSLISVDISEWDATNITNMTNIVRECKSLNSFKPPKNINVSISDFTKSTLLNTNDILSIINNLNTVTTTQTLTLGTTNLAKLTAEQIAIATNKGWTIV